MRSTLKNYFPLIRTRQEIDEEIQKDLFLFHRYSTWTKDAREEFLDFCTGVKGVKILYDSFFKEIMNPEYDPERLNDFLSLLIGQNVRLKEILPVDSTRMSDESSLLSMDILVELEDGTLADLEVQKIGYLFPGQRSACYSADLLLRQYKRIRSEKKRLNQRFSYKDIKAVYVIVFFENSPKDFKRFSKEYKHTVQYVSDTGVELHLPQKFIYICLDVFKQKQDNEDVTIHNKLEAWLTFLCRDEPEKIIELIECYPEFKSLYEDIYTLCRDTEKVMGMFSKELLEMDRNTVKLMIDEMQEEVDGLLKECDQLVGERNQLAGERDQLVGERDQLAGERNQLAEECGQLAEERDQLAGDLEKANEEIRRLKEMLEKK